VDLTRAADRAFFAERPRIDRAAGVLVGSECRPCGTRSWPGRAVCQRCGSADLTDVKLARGGVLTTYTTVRVARPPLDAPYVLGHVTLDDGVILYAHVRDLADGAAAGGRVSVAVSALQGDVPAFWFTAE
jgi:uncharacterized protein